MISVFLSIFTWIKFYFLSIILIYNAYKDHYAIYMSIQKNSCYVSVYSCYGSVEIAGVWIVMYLMHFLIKLNLTAKPNLNNLIRAPQKN